MPDWCQMTPEQAEVFQRAAIKRASGPVRLRPPGVVQKPAVAPARAILAADCAKICAIAAVERSTTDRPAALGLRAFSPKNPQEWFWAARKALRELVEIVDRHAEKRGLIWRHELLIEEPPSKDRIGSAHWRFPVGRYCGMLEAAAYCERLHPIYTNAGDWAANLSLSQHKKGSGKFRGRHRLGEVKVLVRGHELLEGIDARYRVDAAEAILIAAGAEIEA